MKDKNRGNNGGGVCKKKDEKGWKERTVRKERKEMK
jgi:hypothetical protein